jgi:ribosome biogenesis GTPase A
MAKAKRELETRLSEVDCVLEIIDARAPLASRNPDLVKLLSGKLHLVVLNKADLALPDVTACWLQAFRTDGVEAASFSALKDNPRKLFRSINSIGFSRSHRGDLRLLVAGIPNVGKSAVINNLAGRRRADVGAKPGLTRGQQWIRVAKRLIVLDTPGMLWPKFADSDVGYKLAAINAIRAEVLPLEEVALWLAQRLNELAPSTLETSYDLEGYNSTTVLTGIANRRGLYLRGGRLDTERAAALLLREFQQGRLGPISLELPEKGEQM